MSRRASSEFWDLLRRGNEWSKTKPCNSRSPPVGSTKPVPRTGTASAKKKRPPGVYAAPSDLEGTATSRRRPVGSSLLYGNYSEGINTTRRNPRPSTVKNSEPSQLPRTISTSRLYCFPIISPLSRRTFPCETFTLQ